MCDDLSFVDGYTLDLTEDVAITMTGAESGFASCATIGKPCREFMFRRQLGRMQVQRSCL